MEEKLKAISYPFIASVLPEAEIKTKKTKAQSIASEQMEALSQFNKEQNELKIKLCIDWLLKIEFNQLLSNITDNKAMKTKTTESNKEIIVALLTGPLEKRFKFHFLENRKTNNLEKVKFFS